MRLQRDTKTKTEKETKGEEGWQREKKKERLIKNRGRWLLCWEYGKKKMAHNLSLSLGLPPEKATLPLYLGTEMDIYTGSFFGHSPLHVSVGVSRKELPLFALDELQLSEVERERERRKTPR